MSLKLHVYVGPYLQTEIRFCAKIDQSFHWFMYVFEVEGLPEDECIVIPDVDWILKRQKIFTEYSTNRLVAVNSREEFREFEQITARLREYIVSEHGSWELGFGVLPFYM